MGHTRLKRKKKGWATQKVRAQRGGDFNLMAPKKQDLQVIDTFHDFWKMEKGELLNLDIANPLILNIIKWLLLNYCVFALGITPTRPLLQVAPTNNFNFNPYTTAPKGGDLLYKSKLALSKIEVTGRNYVKVPEAVIWGRAAVNLHANFIALCQVLIPGTNPTALHQSIIYIVCDSGPANFRNFGIDSVAAAIQIRAAEAAAAAAAAGVAPDPVATDPDMLTARISARVSIAGAIAALAQAISIGAAQAGQILDHIKNKFVDDIVSALSDVSKTKIGSKASKAISPQKMSRVIGLIYIAPIIIINARDIVAANIAAADIPATAAANAAAIQGVIENSLQLAALDQLPPHAGDVDTLYDAILTDVNVKLVGTATQPFDDTNSDVIKAYVLPNMCHIIDPATTLIAATILAMWAATPDALSQIMAVTTAATKHVTDQYNIGPFVKEISTPQRTADSATAHPQPSTIPGDVYPIIYEFVAQGRQDARPILGAAAAHNLFPEPATGDLDGANVFYSDSNLFTHGRYEIRYERHNWSPITGNNFKYVIGDIRERLPADAALAAAAAAARRYEIEFGDATVGGTYVTQGPSAQLLAACCLERVLRPDPPAAAPPAAPISYDIINQSLNYLVRADRVAILDTITPPIQTVATGNFSKVSNMFHPYIHFNGRGDVVRGPDQFHQLPPELWFDFKRGGDRDQVMAAYQLSLLQENGNPKYPYLVFVTGDRLCGAIAVKKGLATAFKVSSDIKYWPKDIVYAAPPPVVFTQEFLEVEPGWQMNRNAPTAANPESSIHSWGGNQMKGGEYTIITYDTIQDGYGKEYDLKELNNFMQSKVIPILQTQEFKERQLQLVQQLQGQGLLPDYSERHQLLLQEYLLQQLQRNQALRNDVLVLLQQQPPELLQLSEQQLQRLRQLTPQQLPQQLQPQELLQLPQQLLSLLLQIYRIRNTPENYAFMYNTQDNIEKLLLMNFGSGVEIGKILYAMAALPDRPIICTIGNLITTLNHYGILNYANEQAAHAQIEQKNTQILTIIHHNPNKSAAAQQILTTIRTDEHRAAIDRAALVAPVQATAAQIEAAPRWVYDMFAILRFTTVPNKIEHDPSVPVEAEDDQMTEEEEYNANYEAFQVAAAMAAAAAPAAAAATGRVPKRKAAQQMGRGQQQEGGQQSDVEENKKKQLEKIIRLIFDSINQGRGNTMTFSPNHPLYEPIEEIVEEYFELPNLASKIALFTQFCNRRINEEITSAIKQSKVNVEPVTKTPAPAANSTPKVDVEPVAETPAPVANSTPTQPTVDVELVAETPAPVAPVALNTKPKRFTLTAPQKTGKTRIHTFANYPQVIPQLIGTFTVPSNKTQKVTFTKSNKQPLNKNGQKEYVSATTGTVATPGHRGGKHRTHKKCHTKKTRRTQKNHKRKKHGTQRKRSQRQRV